MVEVALTTKYPKTEAVLNYGQKAWDTPSKNCLEMAKKVGQIALVILSFPFVLLIDLVVRMYNCCFKRNVTAYVPPPPAPEVPFHLAGGTPEGPLVEWILKPRYPDNPFVRGVDNRRLFQDAIRYTLKLFNPQQKEIYRQMIINGGYLNEGEGPFDIYHWAARALLAHYLVTKQYHHFARLYPIDRILEGLPDLFLALPDQKKAIVLLQAMTSPTIEWTFDEPTRKVVNLLNAHAQEMTQNQDFLRIYEPIVAEIGNY